MVSSHRILLVSALANINFLSAHNSPSHPRNVFKRIIYEEPKVAGGWNNKEIYKDVKNFFPNGYHGPGADQPSSSSSAPPPQGSTGGTDYIGSDICGNGGCRDYAEYCKFLKQNGQPLPADCPNAGSVGGAPSLLPSSAQGGGRGGGGSSQTLPASTSQNTGGSTTPNSKCGTTSVQCPDNCAMNIRFTSDSMPVPFGFGRDSGGTSQQTSTKDACICMNPGSVSVKIGSTGKDDRSTLIEGNAKGYSDASFFDVSYVEGYTYPIVCWSDADNKKMTGSPIDLYSRGKCTSNPSSTKMGDICENDGFKPLSTPGGDQCMRCTLPSMFFAPTSGAAYAYPYDDQACASGKVDGQAYGGPVVTGGKITCCVGPQCCMNTWTIGGQTNPGNCNRDCKPCANSPVTPCTKACSSPYGKRDSGLREEHLRRRHQHHRRRDT